MAIFVRRFSFVALSCLCLLFGAVALWGMTHHMGCANYAFINKDFACGAQHSITKGDYVSLKNDLHNLIASRTALGEVQYVTLYFRDLRAGPAFGINETEAFAPASLLKLPVALAYLNYEEEHPGTLERKLLYDPGAVASLQSELHQVDYVKPPLVEGQSYTIRELLKSALQYSDNLAFFLAVDYFNRSIPDGGTRLLRVFHELGIFDPRSPAEESISVRNYSGLYRQLFNVSYLNPKHSEEVLSWLAASTFDKGIEAGVPEGVRVAHKFGERVTDTTFQLHDCGIVYFDANPYILCVMTKGNNWEKMADTIKTISQMVYEEVNSRRL